MPLNKLSKVGKVSPLLGKRRVLQALVLSGALDDYIPNRRVVIDSLDAIAKSISAYHKAVNKKGKGDTGELFDVNAITKDPEMPIPLRNNVEPFTEAEIGAFEKEYLGAFLTDNPLEKYREYLLKYCAKNEAEIEYIREKGKGIIGGVILSYKTFMTKRGEEMSHIQVETIPGIYSLVCFPDDWIRCKELTAVGNMVLVQLGTTKNKDLVCRKLRELK